LQRTIAHSFGNGVYQDLAIASGLSTKLPVASRFWDSERNSDFATTVNTSEPISKVEG